MADRTGRADKAREAGFTVRHMSVLDAERLGVVHVAVWRATYEGLMRSDYLASLDPERFAQGWKEQIAASGRVGLMLAGLNAQAEIVGFGVAGPPDDDAPASWQLNAINVLAEFHGCGLADLLMAELVGDRAAFLWVAEGNARAHAFYTAYGFSNDGAVERDERRGQVELRMVRPTVGH